MKLTNMLLGSILGLGVLALVVAMTGVGFHRAAPGQGAELYDPAKEGIFTGVVTDIQDFACPVSEGEIGNHIMLQTARGVVRVHLAPGRVLRSQKITFTPGDELTVVGSLFRYGRTNDVIAREVARRNETFTFRDYQGKLMLRQQ